MKKVLSIIICINLTLLPVLAEYDFSDEAQAEFERQNELRLNPAGFMRKNNYTELKNDNDLYLNVNEELINEQSDNPHKRQLYGTVVNVPAGTSFSVTFDSGISSGSLEKDDRLTVRLTNDLIYRGVLIAPAGSLVYGKAEGAKNAGYAYGSGAIELNFNQILTPDGSMLDISTENIYLEAKSDRASKVTRDVFLGMLGSMLLGAAFTALGGGDNWGRNMLIYGGVGAMGGGLNAVMQTGEEIQIPDGMTIQVKLKDNLNVSSYDSVTN